MNGCEEMRELLSARLDGELTASESQRLAGHLASCEGCRRELAELEKVWDGLGVLAEVEAPRGMEERVLARIAERPAHPAPRRAWLPRWAYALATAAAIILAFVVGNLLWTDGDLDPQTQQIVSNIDLIQNLDVLENLDLLEKVGDRVILLSVESAEKPDGGGS